MRRIISLIISLACSLIAGSDIKAEQPRIIPVEPSREYQIKAAMLYKFAWFTHWEDERFADNNSLITLCLSEPEPFGIFLDQMLFSQLTGTHKRPVTIDRINNDHELELKSCHILFIPKLSSLDVPSVPGLLVVTEEQPIQTSMAHINFVRVGENVKFEVNLINLKESQIRLSSRLLNLATRVVGVKATIR